MVQPLHSLDPATREIPIQRACPSCGAEITERTPGPVQRLQALVRALGLPEPDDLAAELRRINNLRGRSHGGHIPDGVDLLAPERLASTILHGIVSDPDASLPDSG